jgi:hypothetical protein
MSLLTTAVTNDAPTIGAIRDLMWKEHDPKLREQGHVYELWSDGEITLTKGGDLYGQRNNHSMAMPVLVDPITHPLLDWKDDKSMDQYYDVKGKRPRLWCVALPESRLWEVRRMMIEAQYRYQISMHEIQAR